MIATSGGGHALLELWERGRAQAAVVRGDVMLESAGGGAGGPRTLGERNAGLLEFHARLFGDEIDLMSHCPSCGAAAGFRSACTSLTAPTTARQVDSPQRMETSGHVIEFRLPRASDVAEASREATADGFARHLIERCVLACTRDGNAAPIADAPDEVLDALSRRMESLDPAASISFALACPHCGTRWNAPLDVEQLVWTKLQTAAERLLLDIDALARAYGWTERDILALSPIRRAAYVQMVTG
jgi:hypothetical protein